jgi:hypothetical protein
MKRHTVPQAYYDVVSRRSIFFVGQQKVTILVENWRLEVLGIFIFAKQGQ